MCFAFTSFYSCSSLFLVVTCFFFSLYSVPLVIKAFDIDAGLNSHLHYDIVETMPRRYFHIDSTTGAIKTVMLLDHEKIPLFTFHVKVSAFSLSSSYSFGIVYLVKISFLANINIMLVVSCVCVFFSSGEYVLWHLLFLLNIFYYSVCPSSFVNVFPNSESVYLLLSRSSDWSIVLMVIQYKIHNVFRMFHL